MDSTVLNSRARAGPLAIPLEGIKNPNSDLRFLAKISEPGLIGLVEAGRNFRTPIPTSAWSKRPNFTPLTFIDSFFVYLKTMVMIWIRYIVQASSLELLV